MPIVEADNSPAGNTDDFLTLIALAVIAIITANVLHEGTHALAALLLGGARHASPTPRVGLTRMLRSKASVDIPKGAEI